MNNEELGDYLKSLRNAAKSKPNVRKRSMKFFVIREAQSEDGINPAKEGKVVSVPMLEKEADKILSQLWADDRVWWKEEVRNDLGSDPVA